MLFHITAKHTANNCAAINKKTKQALITGNCNKSLLEQKYSVKLINGGFDMAGHKCFFLIECNSAMNISLFCMDLMGHTGGFKTNF